MDRAAGRLEEAQALMEAAVSTRDALGRAAREVSPLSLPLA
jgi:hypothetical protein